MAVFKLQHFEIKYSSQIHSSQWIPSLVLKERWYTVFSCFYYFHFWPPLINPLSLKSCKSLRINHKLPWKIFFYCSLVLLLITHFFFLFYSKLKFRQCNCRVEKNFICSSNYLEMFPGAKWVTSKCFAYSMNMLRTICSLFFIKTHMIFTNYIQLDNTENLVYYFKKRIAL